MPAAPAPTAAMTVAAVGNVAAITRSHTNAAIRSDTLAFQCGTVGLQQELVDDYFKPRRVFEHCCGDPGRAPTCHV